MKVHHIVFPHNLLALLKYGMSGVIAMLIDVSILYVFISTGMSQALGVTIGVAVSSFVHYLICRYYVFRTFKRSFLAGYIYFMSIIGISVALNIGLYLLLVEFIPLHYVVLRIVSVQLIGILSFLLNAHYNFGTLSPKH